MFGFSFSELVVVVIVALVVIGPKDLPRVLRKAGQWAGKLRRMAAEMRAQSGIDDLLRGEGIADDLREIRKLTRGELDTLARDATIEPIRFDDGAEASASPYVEPEAEAREYPVEGADSYGAIPDGSQVYVDDEAPSPLARDPLYMLGDRDGVLPPPAADADDATEARASGDATGAATDDATDDATETSVSGESTTRASAPPAATARDDADGAAATEKSAHE